RLHRDQRGEQGDGDKLGEPADPWVVEHAARDGQPGQLERVTAGGRHQHRHPDPRHAGSTGAGFAGTGPASRAGAAGAGVASAPANAARAARITGTPGGRNGVAARAMAAPSRPTARSVRPARNWGQISARKAAGPTTSMPSDCGDPSRPAPYAPSSVLRFQVT